MPRDLNGNYTLPPGNPVVPATIIETDWANPTMEDIRDALTGSLSRTGQGGMLVPFRNASGAVATPGITWVDEPASGMFRKAAGEFGWAIGGVEMLTISTAGITMNPGRRVSVPDGSTGQQAVNANQLDAALAAIIANTTSIREQQTAIANQTVFTLTTFTYVPNTNNVMVYQNGLRLFAGDYLETSATAITLTNPAAAGDVLLFVTAEAQVLTNPVIINGGTIDDTVIGGTVPAAGTFTNVTTPQITGNTAELLLRTAGGTQVGIVNIASAVNRLALQGGASGQGVGFYPLGTDTNVAINVSTRGAGNFTFFSDAYGAPQFQVRHAANAADHVSVIGAATGGVPIVGVRGTNANVSLGLSSRGTGSIFLNTNDGAQSQVEVRHVAAAVNRLHFQGSVAGSATLLANEGADADIGMMIRAKGTSGILFQTTDPAGRTQFQIGHTAAAVNFLFAAGAAAGNSVALSAIGADTNVGFAVSTKGSGALQLRTGGNAEQVRVTHTAAAVNFVGLTGGAAGVGVVLSAQGADANINLVLVAKGTGVISSANQINAPAFAGDGSQLTNLPSSGGLPAGTVLDYGGAAAPSGFLLCNGAAVSRATFAALFAAIGVAFGIGDGSTTFNVPNTARRTSVGSGGAATGTLGNAVGNVGGAETHLLLSTESGMPAHNHNSNATAAASVNAGAHAYASNLSGATTIINDAVLNSVAPNAASAHNNMQPSIVFTKIIKT